MSFLNLHASKWASSLPAAFYLIATSLVLTSCAHNETDQPASPSEVDQSVWPTLTSPIPLDAALEQRIDTMLARMSIEEKVGQTVQGEIQNIEPGDIKKYHLGSILNGGGSFPGRDKNASVQTWIDLADRFYEESMDTSDGKIAIPVTWGTDAVHGHNNVIGATIFPHNIGLGATRNAQLIEQIGRATAREVLATGIDWIFAPTVAVAQNDLWGRTYESYSEDPKIVAEFAEALVIGMQGQVGSETFLDRDHVVSTVKHFLGDGGTFNGDDQGDATMSEAELSRIHNAGYITTLNAGAQTVMASFSSWNGEKMHGHKYLLTDILKDRMGFDGFVVGDWNGHSQVVGCTKEACAKSVNAGVDMMMVPYDWKPYYHNTIKQVKSGEITEARLDDAVRRILRVKLRAGLFDAGPSQRAFAGQTAVIGHAKHRAVARQAVRESLVLLKNSGILPIKATANVLVAGDGANQITKQSGGWTVSWQGTNNKNSEFPGATSIYWGLKTALEQNGGSATLSEKGDYKTKPDAAIVVFGEDPYAEGHGDRNTLEYQPGSKSDLTLLQKLKADDIPVVSVFLSGRPMWVNPELNASDAFVAAWLPGTEAGGIADVLIGSAAGKPRHDFKGTLSFSWPKTPLQDVLNPHHDNYDPLYAFGYGLTYRSNATAWTTLPEAVEGVTEANSGSMNYYVKRITQPWLLDLHNKEHKQVLSGPFATLPGDDVSLNTTDKDVQEDALLWRWKNTEHSEIRTYGGPKLDASGFATTGAIVLDLKVDGFNSQRFEYYLATTEENFKSIELDPKYVKAVDLTNTIRQNIGKDWFTVTIPLNCFKLSKKELAGIDSLMNLRSNGSAVISLANVRVESEASASNICPN